MFFLRRIRPHSIMTSSFSLRNIQGYVTTGTIVKSWINDKPEWEPYITLYLHKTLNSVIWLGHQLKWKEKIKAIQLFLSSGLYKYVSFRNWMVFLFK